MIILIFLAIPSLSFSQFDDFFEDDSLLDLTNHHPEPEKVITDLLPLLLDNIYNIDFPTADSAYRASNAPVTLMDSLYYFSVNEWDYLTKRGFLLNDSLISLGEEVIDRLRKETCFTNDFQRQLFDSFIDTCKAFPNKAYDKTKVIDNIRYYDRENFVARYGRTVINGAISITPVVFGELNLSACFAITAFWQGHVTRYFVVANKIGKWRINKLISFESD